MPKEISMLNPAHIGAFVREVIEGYGLNVTTAARALGVTRQTLSALVNEHGGLSPEMALRIEKAFGVKMDTMLRMQTVWEIAQARKRQDEVEVERFLAA